MLRTILAALLLVVLPAYAEQNNITQADVQHVIGASVAGDTGVLSASGSYTQNFPFIALQKTTAQSVLFKVTGTSPNYRVEILCSLDGSTNFVKPEQGGDLGTFTGSSYHMVALGTPACKGHKLKFTDLGGNNGQITADELSQ